MVDDKNPISKDQQKKKKEKKKIFSLQLFGTRAIKQNILKN